MSKTAELNQKLEAARQLGLLYETFRHYKGGIYTVEDVVCDTDDGSIRVLYYRVGGPDFDADAESMIRFVRPIGEFLGQTDEGLPRFRKVQSVQTWVDAEPPSE